MARIRLTKRGVRLILLGVAVYLVFLVVSLPASFLTRYVLPAMPAARNLQLQGVNGSIWNGQAAEARFNNFNLGKLNWEFNAWGLLLGNLDMLLRFRNDTTQGRARINLGLGGSLSANNVDVQMPAERLAPLMYGFPVSLAGEVHGNLKELELEPGETLQGRGRIVWRAAALRAPQNIELGDIVTTLEPVNRGSKLVIKDQGQGPVETDITITVKGNGEYKMNGWFKPRDASQQHITEALRLIGRADNAGRYWVAYNGTLRGWRSK